MMRIAAFRGLYDREEMGAVKMKIDRWSSRLEKALGNPLFAEETLRGVAEEIDSGMKPLIT